MMTFKKEERLCSKKLIESLFKNGKTFFSFPFTVKWSIEEGISEFPAKVLIVVPKRIFKRAVDRNRIKRLIRESYRLNKHTLYQNFTKENININLALIYTGKEILTFKVIEEKIKLILQRLSKVQES